MVLGILKRFKNIASSIGEFVDKINSVYKQVSPILGPILQNVPFGGKIKSIADTASVGWEGFRKNIDQHRPLQQIDNNQSTNPLISNQPINRR